LFNNGGEIGTHHKRRSTSTNIENQGLAADK
jgi:hypothetical protein